jgi:hypothetical protein
MVGRSATTQDLYLGNVCDTKQSPRSKGETNLRYRKYMQSGQCGTSSAMPEWLACCNVGPGNGLALPVPRHKDRYCAVADIRRRHIGWAIQVYVGWYVSYTERDN